MPVSIVEVVMTTDQQSDIWERSAGEVVETLRQALKDSNMSLDELASRSGIAREEVKEIFEGTRELSAQTSGILATTLSARLLEIFRQMHALPAGARASRGEARFRSS